MNTVQPIRKPELIEEIKAYLEERSERDHFLFVMGINIGLRITDMLSFKVRDVRGKDEIPLRERKTGKEKLIPINPKLKRAIAKYTKEMKPNDYLFSSRQRDGNNLAKPITRERAYQILQDVAEHFKLERIGTHSLRKTYGLHLYEKTKDIALLMYIFNHSTEAITLRYIGKNQESYSKAMSSFGL
ncbi:site-specific integrase [Paenibacillus sp. 2TAB19]|uniref:site-specific integrase n=1 Tax=Paenibacillus sp. 2TAB19 TaxID=3233003 RepID=UPI003F95E41E